MRDIREIAPTMENAQCPLEGVATAAQPSGEHLGNMAEAGYRAVLDLRTPEEPRGLDESEAVRDAGMEYVNIPVSPDTLDDETFGRFRELMNDPGRRPILVHCSSANRVGALLMPYLTLDEGRSTEEAARIARQIGLRSDELEQKARQYARSNGG